MKRKQTFVVIALVFVLAVTLLAGCQQTATPTPAATAKPAATAAPAGTPATAATKPAGTPAAAATQAPAATKPAAAAPTLSQDFRLSFATGGTAGTYYPYGGAMAGLWSQNVQRLSVNVEATGGSVENLRRLDNKEADLALVQNDIADYAFNGTEMFQGEKIESVRAIGALYPELLQWAVNPDIKTLQDLKGKRFVVGAAGSGTEVNTRQVLEANGMSFQDLGRTVNLSFAEAANAMKDRQVDGFAVTGGVPTAAITDTLTAVDVVMLPIEGDMAQKVLDQYKFYVQAKIPANSYKNQTADVNTIAVQAMLVAHQDLDDDVVYLMTKTLVEKQQELAQSHAKGKELSRDSIAKGFTIPLHPGAERYYKEAGIIP